MKEDVEKSLDPKLWIACAGGMAQMLPVNTKVYYFPQGHAEHTLTSVDFGSLPRIPPMILCRIAFVKYLADHETDEVYTKMGLIPQDKNEYDFNDVDDGVSRVNRSEYNENPNPFAKTLTQSDANNGGGFSVPRYCAETLFPKLDYSTDPPVQNVIVKDVHGETWKFRHIYRGTPRRHLLTTGWSSFVNQKKLVAGDSIVFLRAENGDLCVGIRRAKKVAGIGGNESASVWNSGSAGNFGGFSAFLDDEKKVMHRSVISRNSREKGRVTPESVLEAAYLAANGRPFEVVYYPRNTTPEFCVKASYVNAAMRIHWCSGIRFKMPFETEDSSRISWFMGTVTSVQVSDPVRWSSSLWRILQVTWDEPDLLQNVKCVSPWLVEIIANIPVLHLSHFSPPRKKLRLPCHPDYPLDGKFPLPSFSGNPLGPSSPFCCLSDNISAGIQGARHSQIVVPSSGLHLSNKLQVGLLPASVTRGDPQAKISDDLTAKSNKERNENISCLLSIGNSSKRSEKTDGVKTPLFVLFGQPILTEQQLSDDQPSDAVSKVAAGRKSSGGTQWTSKISVPTTQNLSKGLSTDHFFWKQGHHGTEIGLDTGHCNVFLESDDVGRALDLSVLTSYEELYKKLEHMFGIDRLELPSQLFYHDATGAVKQSGEEPFSEFVKSAKRLTILTKSSSSSNTNTKQNLITGLPTAGRGLDSSNQAGPLSIFA